jgi:hypothetical protein
MPIKRRLTLIRQGGTWVDIFEPAGASSNTSTTASLLASEVARLAGSGPSVLTASSVSRGIRVGLYAEWIAVGAPLPDWGVNWTYAITNLGGSIYIVGLNDQGVSIGIRRFLAGLGHKVLWSPAEWELAPTLGPSVQAPPDEGPARCLAFVNGLALSFDNGTASMTTRRQNFLDRNGCINDKLWSSGHSYAAMIAANQAAFDAHDEYTGGGHGAQGNKVCAFEPGVQAIALSYAQGQAGPARNGVSLAAADGDVGWSFDCSGTHEQIVNNPSRRQLELANYVAENIQATNPGTYIVINAYAGTSAAPVPATTVHPFVVVLYATAFMEGGLTPEQVRDNYIAQGATKYGPYSYVSEWPWDFDKPGIARFTQRAEVELECGRLSGAFGWGGEGSMSGVTARGYYAFAASLFATESQILARWDEFPSVAFPHATSQAQAFYTIVEQRQPLSSDFLHRLGQAALDLVNAVQATGGSELERALDLARYVNYVDLYRRYTTDPNASTLEPLLQFMFRIRERDVVTYSAFYDMPTYATDRKAVAALHSLSDLTKNSNVWPDTATTLPELQSLLASIVAANALLPFEPIGYTNDLVRVAGLSHASSVRGAFVEQTKSFDWDYFSTTGADVFTFKGGVVRQDKGPDHVQVLEFASGEVVWDEDIPADQVSRTTQPGNGFYPEVLTTPQTRYIIRVTAAGGLTWSWAKGSGVSIATTPDVPVFTGSFSGYFYWPRGVPRLGFFGNGTIRFFSADNIQVNQTNAANDYYAFDVPLDGSGNPKDGQAYKFTGATKLGLLTVPPNWAEDEGEIAVPVEVLEADGLSPWDATIPAVARQTPWTADVVRRRSPRAGDPGAVAISRGPYNPARGSESR